MTGASKQASFSPFPLFTSPQQSDGDKRCALEACWCTQWLLREGGGAATGWRWPEAGERRAHRHKRFRFCDVIHELFFSFPRIPAPRGFKTCTHISRRVHASTMNGHSADLTALQVRAQAVDKT